jgi:ribosome-binding factor A
MKREISEILRTSVRDPRIGHPTITGVEVTPDLWMARVFVRADPSEAPVDGEELLKGLETAAPFIRREVGKSLRLRRVPELRFVADETLEYALRIERILREVLPEDGEERCVFQKNIRPDLILPPFIS